MALAPTSALASVQQCHSNKYYQYIDASLEWYKNLVDMTLQKHPYLKEVSTQLLQGRMNHFKLNREVFN